MKVEIKFTVKLPDIPHTDEQIEEYLRFAFGDNGSMSGTNPFVELPTPEPIFGTFEFEEI